MTQLKFILIKREDITDHDIKRMYSLMQDAYDYVQYASFVEDLSNKQYIGLLIDLENTIQGFTTYAINPKNTGTQEYNIIFSGDTIIHPNFWGSQEMIKGGVKAAGFITQTDPQKKWYWFLISKGHRTYMYLPLFFEKFYPAFDPLRQDALFPIVDKCASALYPNDWKAKQGLIVFTESHGQLKPELAEASYKKKNNRHVAFFLEKNPSFYKGDELACITLLNSSNMKGFVKDAFLLGQCQKNISSNED